MTILDTIVAEKQRELERLPARQPFIDTFARASRLILRLRQKVVAPPLPVFLPSWIVDPDFDLGFHLRFGRLPAPGSLVELLDAVQSEVTAPLDSDRPLWEAVLLEGYAGGRAAVIIKMSHAITDGIGALELFAALIDTARAPDKGPMPPAPVLERDYGSDHWDRVGVSYGPSLRLFRAKGCAKCWDTGYKGRMGIHELLVGTDEVKRMVQKRKPVEELGQQAIREGMTTLLQDGIAKVLRGHTDFKQVRAVCIK